MFSGAVHDNAIHVNWFTKWIVNTYKNHTHINKYMINHCSNIMERYLGDKHIYYTCKIFQ